VAYLVECRTTSLDASLDAERLLVQVLDSLQRSQVVREPALALDPRTRSLTMTARIETAQTPQLAAVMAANELLWRTNQYCGDDAAAHVKMTHLVSQLAGA
jgi:glutamate/tyrosine decarboxylase-like PLP-dependent enzyme